MNRKPLRQSVRVRLMKSMSTVCVFLVCLMICGSCDTTWPYRDVNFDQCITIISTAYGDDEAVTFHFYHDGALLFEWGDGKKTYYERFPCTVHGIPSVSHVYKDSIKHTIKIYGNIDQLYSDCNYLTELDASKNTSATYFSIQGNLFTSDALNRFFHTLVETVEEDEKLVSIFGSPGSFECDISIATEKGWNVRNHN